MLDPFIVCNIEHRFLVAEQCQEIGVKNPKILLEPEGRNTAPAISVASLQAVKDYKDVTLLILSADHAISDKNAFHQAIYSAYNEAQREKLVTLGITPTEPNTNYGYIKFAHSRDSSAAFCVDKFVEKPNISDAEKYFKSKNFLWNAGIFVFKASTVMKELLSYSPQMVKQAENSIENSANDLDFIRLSEVDFKSFQNISIDHALMEKSNSVSVVPLDAGWSDIGTWSSLYDFEEKDQNGNVIHGDAFIDNVNGSFIYAKHHLVVGIDIEDLVVVDTPNATLISSKSGSGKLKRALETLSSSKRSETCLHRKVFRPWGWYDSIESGEYFQVKRLHVNPGAKLSLQLHKFRAEHWVVVKGVATVVSNGEVSTLQKGESVYIPKNSQHSLANKTNKPLEVIEVQSGSYLGEDDIERFEDIYGRANN